MGEVTLSTPSLRPAMDAAAVKSGKSDDPAKVREAAEQFEGLLLAQVLQSAHDEGGWLGSGEDSASSCAGGFAECCKSSGSTNPRPNTTNHSRFAMFRRNAG